MDSDAVSRIIDAVGAEDYRKRKSREDLVLDSIGQGSGMASTLICGGAARHARNASRPL